MNFKFFIKDSCTLDFIRINNYSIGRFITPNGSFYIRIKDKIYYLENLLFGWTRYVQDFLYKRKIYYHNFFLNECTPMFECCINKVDEKDKQLLKSIAATNMEEIPYITINDKGERI